MSMVTLILFAPGIGLQSQGMAPDLSNLMVYRTGISLIAEGLMAYGIIAIALIQFRKSQIPPMEAPVP